jgi:quercetin dioxygenase-like cupin family protein
MRISNRWLLAFVFGVGVAVTALATPGSGVVSNVISRATLSDGVNVKFKNRFTDFEAKLQIKGPADFISQQVAFAPGGTSGWHSHSGPALVSIASGTATFYQGDDPTCSPIVVPAGSAFVEQGEDVHILRNEGTADVVLKILYLTPVGAPQRIDEPAPGNCRF